MPQNNSAHAGLTQRVKELVQTFYKKHTEIKASHGWEHVGRVHQHAVTALASLEPPLASQTTMEIEMAALLHDLDDKKYFPNTPYGSYPNAQAILKAVGMNKDNLISYHIILDMISWVGCSENGNSVPPSVAKTGQYYRLIPRWADRLEAVGARGVVRCYQYSVEKERPLSCPDHSPRPTSEKELWEVATPDRFVAYQERGGSSDDMISHYYDKLLHIARPPKEIVCNPYLEQAAQESAKELLEVCLRYGKTGVVDEAYILSLLPT